jgi:hypothetical protein
LVTRFFAGFFTRARLSPSTSADTSNVQRTRRPGRTGDTLIGCFFGTALLAATPVPTDFPRQFARSGGRSLQNRQVPFNSYTPPLSL